MGENSPPEFLFATVPTNHVIQAWQIDAASGALATVPGSPFAASGGELQGLAIHPSGRFLYVANFPANPDMGGISAYSIAANGALAPIGPEVRNDQQGGASVRVTVDAAGAHAYVASNLSIGAAIFTIDPMTGALTPMNPMPFDFQNHHGTEDVVAVNRMVYLTSAVGIDSQTINSDGSLSSTDIASARTEPLLNRLAVSGGRFLYATTVVVPPPGNPFAAPEPGHIFGWLINADGSLTQIPSTPVALDGVQAIAASGNLLFASSPAGVTVYTIDANSGVLTKVTGSPFGGMMQPGDLAVDHSGKFLYEITGNAIAAFMIAGGGALSPVTGSPFSSGNVQPFALVSSP